MRNLRLLIQCAACCLIASLSITLPASASPLSDASSDAPMDEQALLEAMQSRLDALMALKLKGSVGESNRGLLEAREDLGREQRRLISDENQNRLSYYKLTADKLGVPVAAVQRKRAEQIRENSPRGIWIESKLGVWYRD